MPVESKAQFRFMAAAKHSPGFAKKAGIKQSVARDFLSKTHAGYGALPEKKAATKK